jgi:hypothetical protein
MPTVRILSVFALAAAASAGAWTRYSPEPGTTRSLSVTVSAQAACMWPLHLWQRDPVATPLKAASDCVQELQCGGGEHALAQQPEVTWRVCVMVHWL